jgi:hypothetical protein
MSQLATVEELSEAVFSTQSVLRLYNSDFLAMKNSCEIGTSQGGWRALEHGSRGHCWIHCQATPSEDIEDLVHAIVRSNVRELLIVLRL